MCRLAAPEHLRLRQARELDVTYAGAEASVAASICNFGGAARYVTALPKHALAEATMDTLRALGIDTRYVLRTDTGRLGLYFLETGANQRPSNVLYDRADSAIANTPGRPLRLERDSRRRPVAAPHRHHPRALANRRRSDATRRAEGPGPGRPRFDRPQLPQEALAVGLLKTAARAGRGNDARHPPLRRSGDCQRRRLRGCARHSRRRY